jgi:multiple antibiotic resistance protein
MMNPPTTAVLFLGLARGKPASWFKTEIRRTALFVFCTLTVAWFAGAGILSVFGISIAGLQLAGALVVSFIGFRMLFPPPAAATAGSADDGDDSIAFVPLTIPSLCGPGTLALVLSAATEVEQRVDWPERWWVHGGMMAAIGTVTLISWGVLSMAEPMYRALGRAGINALTRIMGFLLICIGMQFLISALTTLVDHMMNGTALS